MFPRSFSSGVCQSRRQSRVSRGRTSEIALKDMTLYQLRAHAGLRSNEGFANRAIQLFGLFRVFGEQLDGSQNEQARKPQLILLLLRT